MPSVTLDLPEPPAFENERGHYMKRYRDSEETKRATWSAALKCLTPPPFPPGSETPVRISAHFRLWNLRDETGLVSSLKDVLDALKQRQSGRARFRRGLFEFRGYFYDDDPKHCTVEKPTQEIDRANRGLTLTIEWDEED